MSFATPDTKHFPHRDAGGNTFYYEPEKSSVLDCFYTTEMDLRVYRFATQLTSASTDRIKFSHHAYRILSKGIDQQQQQNVSTSTTAKTTYVAAPSPTTETNVYDRMILCLLTGSFAFARALVATQQVAIGQRPAAFHEILRNHHMLSQFVELVCKIHDDMHCEAGRKWTSTAQMKSHENYKYGLLSSLAKLQQAGIKPKVDEIPLDAIHVKVEERALKHRFESMLYDCADDVSLHPLHRMLRLLGDASFTKDDVLFKLKDSGDLASTGPQRSDAAKASAITAVSEALSTTSNRLLPSNGGSSRFQRDADNVIKTQIEKESRLIDIPTDTGPDELGYFLSGKIAKCLTNAVDRLESFHDDLRTHSGGTVLAFSNRSKILEWLFKTEHRLVLFVHLVACDFETLRAESADVSIKRNVLNKIHTTFNELTRFFVMQMEHY